MSAKERFKAGLFVISLLTIGHVGNFYPLLLENADAHPHTVIQSTVVQIITLLEMTVIEDNYSTSCDRIKWTGELPFIYQVRCSGTITGTKYTDYVMDYEYTIYYLDDGHEVYWEPGGSKELPETYRSSGSYVIGGCNRCGSSA